MNFKGLYRVLLDSIEHSNFKFVKDKFINSEEISKLSDGSLDIERACEIADIFNEMSESGNFMEDSNNRKILTLESCLKTPSVFLDMDEEAAKKMEAEINELKKSVNEEIYDEWKENYIQWKLKEIKKKGKKIFVCDYLFAGIGKYTEYLSEDELQSFDCFIQGCGSGFADKPRLANNEQIRTWICLNASEEC